MKSKLPVVIGAGISGLIISKYLSKAGLRHIVIGKPKTDDHPVLGESMNEITSHELSHHFSDYKSAFFPKQQISMLRKNKRIQADTSHDVMSRFFELYEFYDGANADLIHVDRIQFDRQLADEVLNSEFCEHIPDFIECIGFNKETDSVEKIVLRSGKELEPQYVFDASNNARLIGKVAGLTVEKPDEPRTVVFDHFYSRSGTSPCDGADQHPWMHSTNIAVLDKMDSSFPGVAWAIPLGQYISVGVSIRQDEYPDADPGDILNTVKNFYHGRGVRWGDYYPDSKKVTVVPSQHYSFNRFYGRNWALSGGAALQVWYPSGSNIGVSISLAKMSEKIISEPEKYGEIYTRGCRAFQYIQNHYHKFFNIESPNRIDYANMGAAIVLASAKRFSAYRLGFERSVEVETLINRVLDDKMKYFPHLPMNIFDLDVQSN